MKARSKSVTALWLRNSQGDLVATGRNMFVVVLDEEGKEQAVHRVTYGSLSCLSMKATASSAVRGLPNGILTPARSLPKSTVTVAYRRPCRRRFDVRAGRRGHRYRQASDHRLALDPARGRSAPGHGDQGQEGRDPQDRSWRRRPCACCQPMPCCPPRRETR
jgi:hypothetical protein